MAITRPPTEQANIAATAADAPPPSLEHWTGDRGFFGHPRGLSTLSFTEMWERFSYYGIRPLLILYMTLALAEGGFGFERSAASAIVGIYAASVYLASLPGGWIADRWLGLRRAIWWGGVLIAFGHLSIALSSIFARPAFFLGLVFIVMGTGLLKPNISAIVGDLYPEGGSRRDAGFSIFYMGINTGALVAPLVTGLLQKYVGWHWAFGAAGICMVLGLITYRVRQAGTLGPIGLNPTASPDEQRRVRNYTLVGVAIIAVVVLFAATGVIHIDPVSVAEKMTVTMLSMAALYFAYLFFLAGLNKDEKKRVVIVLVLFIFSMVFWSAFEQAPTSLNLFARDFTDRHIFGWEAPTLWLQSAEATFVVIFAPIFALVWTALGKRGKDPSSPAKFAFGLACAGVGFLLMLFAANRAIAGGTIVRVSMMWLVFSYMMQAFGELAVSPVGLSSMTKLAPPKFGGQMMGVWFMSLALGNLFAGLVGGHVDPNKLEEMPALFQRTAMSLFIAAVVLLALVVPIRKMMAERSGPRA